MKQIDPPDDAEPDNVQPEQAEPEQVQPEQVELTATAWTALGFIAVRPRSGYEIKQACAETVDAFWGVSYAQLYPQLKRLREAWFITGEESGGGRRQVVWHVTERGRRALDAWLVRPPAPPQLRDEALLKLQFVQSLSPAQALPLIRAKRREFEEWIARFTPEGPPSSPDEPADLLHSYALTMARAGLTWCDAVEKALDGAAGSR
ncbi:PadR family transcriptional regulator [Streptomyces cavernicola]|uniref:PadR family transcriptional regulator n=1 Tax=Streptomyces cavernicola TaxID=3043613 RepID=A0ABT6SAB2_9ACTN|nr:PadR family transcriptional regulator [Streptomyces sp. B-S-A6]MDI3405122.1 PadR family transcriptional regulator [Streptomyces sp. B-S-A6]